MQKAPLKNAVLVLSEVKGTGTVVFWGKHPLKKSVSVLSETEGRESRSEMEVLQMQEATESTRDTQLDEELADVLIAISVIAKRLARKLQAVNQEGGTTDGENERTGCAD